MSVRIHGKEYAEVKDRIQEFRTRHPDWSIITDIPYRAEDFRWCVFRAIVRSKDDTQAFFGWAYEERTDDKSEVNFTAWVENCETSAIGRALANMGIQISDQRPSAEEMDKVQRMKGETTPAKGGEAVQAKPFLRKKVGPTTLSSSDKLKADIMHIKGEITRVMGHDQVFQQALMNRNLTSLDETITLQTLAELKESLAGFYAYLGERLAEMSVGDAEVTFRNLTEDERKELSESLKKMTMLL